MKVKSLLNLSSATRVNLLGPYKGHRCYDFDIDYLREGSEPTFYDSFSYHTSPVSVPEEVMNAAVHLVSTNEHTGALVIYFKGGLSNE